MDEVPPNVALAQLFAAAASEAEARQRLSLMLDNPAAHDRAEQMYALWQRLPGAYARVHRIDGIARAGASWDAVFDAAAAIDPCTAVALYSLGDAALLRAATDEIVAALKAWQVLGPEAVVLDFGCGTGRIAAAVSPLVARVLGVDVSSRMVDVARAAVAKCANAAIIRTESLAALRGDRFDVVLAIDSMPYVVESGSADQAWADAAALLDPGGVFLVMNYSYRCDVARDQQDVTRFAARHRFEVLRNGTRDLSYWDGRAFLMRKR
jgi:SAM-dependent methyltransferase